MAMIGERKKAESGPLKKTELAMNQGEKPDEADAED
jgi:hypothetical protein